MKFERHMVRVLPVLFGCLVSIVHAPAQSQDVLVLENFSERLSKDVPVSGRVLVGAVVLPDQTGKAPASPTPMLLWRRAKAESTEEPLCVTFASRDGQYYGEGMLSAAKLASRTGPGRVRVRHTPDAEKHLDALTPQDLAVLASTGDCRLGASSGKTTIYVVDHRGNATVPSRGSVRSPLTLQLMLNSMTYTLTVEATIPGVAEPQQAKCEPLPDVQRNKAYNTVCKLPVLNDATEAELVINRRRFERRFDPIRFKLVWSLL